MAGEAADRHVWVVETLTIRPDDRVLEIGCGHGVTASLVCERLGSGALTAIDASSAMVELAAARNRAHVDAGRASFRVTSLEQADFGDDRFDKVFAMRVGLFWKEPQRAVSLVAPLLVPGGGVYLFQQPPAWRDAARFAARWVDALRSGGFADVEVVWGKQRPAVLCVRARR